LSKSKQKGTAFETSVVNYLQSCTTKPIERRTLSGANDKGDVAGVFIDGLPIVVECKACSRMEVPKWLREAQTERNNARAAVGIVVAKRQGVGTSNMGQQLVMMTLDDFSRLID
jgi:hypothetical protein